MLDRIKLFLNPFSDGRYEDMSRGWKKTVVSDFTAGLIVAMLAIPMNMGFAIASGLHPVHGLIAGALACLLGALFGGSKYQVYGPTAAYIPVLAAIMSKYGNESTDPSSPEYIAGYYFLILCSVLGGVILIFMGLGGMGDFINRLVPHSIVVGFTIGIALTIAFTQIGDVLGLTAKIPNAFLQKISAISSNLDQFNIYAVLIAVGTFLLCKYLLRYAAYIPGPVIAVALGILLNETILHDQGLTASIDKYGTIPTSDFFKFTLPKLSEMNFDMFGLVYFTAAVVFVAAIESLLCSKMADRMAENKGTPYNPNKELFGQGMVNIFAPLFNGFTCTGALARTATNIKVGGVTPLAGILNCGLKLSMVYFLAAHLDQVPMACIGGILAYIAFNMVKKQEIQTVMRMNGFHIFLMILTAVVVFVKDFLSGVLLGLAVYVLLRRFFDRPQETAAA